MPSNANDRETHYDLTTFRRVTRVPKLSRLSYLMALYHENYQKATRWIQARDWPCGVLISSVDDGMDLQIEVLEQHAYTTVLKLSYLMKDPHTGESDPSAFVRIYHDTRQLEVTHCYVGTGWQDVIGMSPPSEMLYAHRLQMNVFFSKWLDYLREAGHGVADHWSLGDEALLGV